jgi:iron complex transport system substrate-binding protein
VPEVGFQGMGAADTAGIEILPMTTLNLEHLATLQPDTIVTLQFWLEQIGPGQLEALADVIAIPDGLPLADRLTTLGEELGRPEHAAAVVAEHEAAVEAATATVGDGCVVSLAAVYPGPSVAAFVVGPWELPTSILDTGCQLDPDPSVAEPDGNGRVWLSLEQLGVLDAERIVLLQNDHVEGEPEALAEIEANPLWTSPGGRRRRGPRVRPARLRGRAGPDPVPRGVQRADGVGDARLRVGASDGERRPPPRGSERRRATPARRSHALPWCSRSVP